MHHVRVSLHKHQSFHAHASVFRNPAEVITAEVHEHDVLGALLRIGEHLRFESLIFALVAPAWTSSGNRAIKSIAPLHFHKHFGRTACDSDVAELQIIKIGRWIHHAERAVNLKWVHMNGRGKPLAHHYLKGVARANVFLGFLHCREKLRFREVGNNLRGAGVLQFTNNGLFRRHGLVHYPPQCGNFPHCRSMFRAKAPRRSGINIANNPHAVLHVVEHDESEEKHHHSVIEVHIVPPRFRNSLELPHHVISKISDSSSNERRQSGNSRGLIPRDHLAQKFHRLRVFHPHPALGLHDTRTVAKSKYLCWVCADKCVSRNFLASFHAF